MTGPSAQVACAAQIITPNPTASAYGDATQPVQPATCVSHDLAAVQALPSSGLDGLRAAIESTDVEMVWGKGT
jgi:hypothetical protein